jgi:hypothetical protein
VYRDERKRRKLKSSKSFISIEKEENNCGRKRPEINAKSIYPISLSGK